MKTLKLTVKEITELQPNEVSYASESGELLGGVEVTGDIDHAALVEKCAEYFGDGATLYGEGNDGDCCVHYAVIKHLLE